MSTTSNQANQRLTSTCPECAAGVTFTRPPLQGEVIRCRECTAELEVTGTAPIRADGGRRRLRKTGGVRR